MHAQRQRQWAISLETHSKKGKAVLVVEAASPGAGYKSWTPYLGVDCWSVHALRQSCEGKGRRPKMPPAQGGIQILGTILISSVVPCSRAASLLHTCVFQRSGNVERTLNGPSSCIMFSTSPDARFQVDRLKALFWVEVGKVEIRVALDVHRVHRVHPWTQSTDHKMHRGNPPCRATVENRGMAAHGKIACIRSPFRSRWKHSSVTMEHGVQM